mgnify:CR=1 FL=1
MTDSAPRGPVPRIRTHRRSGPGASLPRPRADPRPGSPSLEGEPQPSRRWYLGDVQIVSTDPKHFGVIAVGQEAWGIIAIGQMARGFVVLGQLAVGVIGAGQLACVV